MPPKKSQIKQISKKKPAEKCHFNNRGYCKSKEDCDKKHSDDICEDLECPEEECEKRHPYECTFGIRCKFNKRRECMYLHDALTSDDTKIAAIKKEFANKLVKLESSFVKIQKDLDSKNSLIELLMEKYDNFEKQYDDKQIDSLKKHIEVKDAQINGLEIKLEELDKAQQKQKKHFEKKLKDIENTLKQKLVKEKTPASIFPESIFPEKIKCNKCDYTTTSRQGLKIHTTKSHSKVDFVAFPTACDVCEKVLENESKLREHKKNEHTYHTVKFQCNECEFMASDPHTLQVHFGINHSSTKHCGLCDDEFKNAEEVEDHLTQCKIHVCSNSHCRDIFKELPAMKEHIKEEHRKNSPSHYSFSYYICHSQNKTEKEVTKQYISIYPKDW